MIVEVLMIDDHPTIIEGYKAILVFGIKDYQLEVAEAFTGQAAFEIITTTQKRFDVALIDLTIPSYLEKNIASGEDLIPLIKKHHPSCKIIILTSHSESIILQRITKEYHPEGIFVKSDFQAKELISGFDAIVKEKTYFTQTIVSFQKTWNEKSNLEFDTYNQQILALLNQGVKTKRLPDLLHLSQSAVDKRKAVIKTILGIDKGNDEDILKAARKKGLI
ncbi:MAG TPA: response regulator [Flavobacterium sp.]|uniref:response regulator n=1 Tax=Flavobacterium sp. TaxID=239 RepID=UPI002D0EAB7F|nr:response regulator [Flavobacterium sp.]HPW97035.1 response regulator [Flavobacterium sp.]HQA74435.1 response regulator [Flavobacterium sp.]